MKIFTKECNFMNLLRYAENNFANNIVFFDEVSFELHRNVNANASDTFCQLVSRKIITYQKEF